jgi:hypothetical protein
MTETATTTDTRPPLNETSYPVWRQEIEGQGLTEGATLKPELFLFTSKEWRSRRRDGALTEGSRRFAENTDFSSEAIVALEIQSGAGLNRWVVESVEGVRTTSLELRFWLWESHAGLNNDPRRLVLVRVPTRGTKPTKATAHLEYDPDRAETISTSR